MSKKVKKMNKSQRMEIFQKTIIKYKNKYLFKNCLNFFLLKINVL